MRKCMCPLALAGCEGRANAPFGEERFHPLAPPTQYVSERQLAASLLLLEKGRFNKKGTFLNVRRRKNLTTLRVQVGGGGWHV
jgi:hypothetical protein